MKVLVNKKQKQQKNFSLGLWSFMKIMVDVKNGDTKSYDKLIELQDQAEAMSPMKILSICEIDGQKGSATTFDITDVFKVEFDEGTWVALIDNTIWFINKNNTCHIYGIAEGYDAEEVCQEYNSTGILTGVTGIADKFDY